DALRQRYLTLAETVRERRRQWAKLDAERQQRQRELALLRFEREELDAAGLRPGEVAELARERERLAHAPAVREFAEGGCARLYDDEGSCFEQLGKLLKEAQHWAALDPALADAARRLEGLGAETRDLAETFRDLAQHWEADPQRQEEVEDRLQLLR